MPKHRAITLTTFCSVAVLAVMMSACIRGGRLEVRAVPTQAYVYLDGTPMGDSGRSRDHNVLINGITPGEHTVGIYNYGYKPEVHKVNIVAGETTRLRVPMTPEGGAVSGPWGRIQIEGGKHAAVLLNGKTPEYMVGNADEFNNDWGWKQELLVPPGTHQLTIQDRDTTVWSGPVTVAANQRVIVEVNKGGTTVTRDWPEGQNLNNIPRFQAGTASARVAVAAPTAKISAGAAQIGCGESARLTWSSTDAVAGEISGLGNVAPSGDREVQPKETTTYNFKASGPGGSAASSATVNLNKEVQASLSVSPAEIRYERVGNKVNEQGSATVSWSTSNASSVSVDPFGTVNATGSRSVEGTPKQTGTGPVDETLTYTLNASNDCGGSTTRTATLHIAGEIKPGITEASLETVLASVYFPTAYPEKRAADVGLVASQRHDLTEFAEGFKKYLEADPNAKIRLEGNADQRGSQKYNMALSDRRVEIVRQFLVGQGIPASAIEVKALGEDNNLDRAAVNQLRDQNPNKPSYEMVGRRARVDWLAHNRRVDIVLLPSGLRSNRFYPYSAGDFKILWQAPRPARKAVEQAQ